MRLVHILQLYVAKTEILADELLSCDFFRRCEGAYVVQNPVLLCASFRWVEDVLELGPAVGRGLTDSGNGASDGFG